MPQEYEVTSFKPSDFRDSFNNTWCDMAVMGFGEPVKIVLKDPSSVEVGKKLYGTINEQKSKAGKTYYKFKKEQRPDYEQRQEKSDEYWSERNLDIRAQFAIKTAAGVHPFPDIDDQLKDPAALDVYLSNVEYLSNKFFSMVDRVSGKETVSEEKDAQAVAKMVDDGIPINMEDVPL